MGRAVSGRRGNLRADAARGMAESLEWALLTPVLMLTIFAVIQGGILLHGRSTVQQAAMAGAEAQAVMGATAGVAVSVATDVATQGDLVDISVTASTSGGFVTVTVTARARTTISTDMSWVTSSATVPLEAP